jgi:DNA-binding winged helix-turn-helix (wHTH) protein/TolB-like protein/tetratricopeptide (TPR) repeat protein
MSLQAQPLYEFGPFQLDPTERRLLQRGRPVPLTPKAFQTLLVLVENEGHVVEKEELLRRIWPDTFVEEATLAQNVFTLRKQLGDDRSEAIYIETVPKRGYRFRAPVRCLDSPAAEAEIRSAPLSAQAGAEPSSRARMWVGAVVLALLLATSAIYSVSRRSAPKPHRMMLVVLPVQNLTGDASRNYVTDGFTEELIAQLGSLNPAELGVIARTSAMAYKNGSKTAAQIGHELHVDYALECSVRELAGETRFTAQLIRTSDETHVWAHSFERANGDLLALQREIARTVADEIRVNMTPRSKARLSGNGVNPEAYDAFVQGRYHWNGRSAKELRTAVSLYQQAIEKDADFAPAYVGLADSYAMLATMREEAPREMMPKAKDALLKALALDDSLAEAHTSLGWILEVFDWDWTGSERELQKAIDLDPNDPTAHHRYAIHLAAMGRLPEALSQMYQAQRIDPLAPVIRTSTGWVLLRGRLPAQAMVECRKALDIDPKFVRAHLCMGEAYEQEGDLNHAAQEFLQGKILGGDTPDVISALKEATARAGYVGYFRQRLAQLVEKAKTSYVSPYDLADTYLRLGEKDEAMKWLNTAYEERSPYLINLQIEPRLDTLRADPRFQDLVGRVGLKSVTVAAISSQSLGLQDQHQP